MKNTNKQKTTEQLLKEIGFAMLLMLSMGLLFSAVSKCESATRDLPTIEDLHQQQEMIDYHRAQGREVGLTR